MQYKATVQDKQLIIKGIKDLLERFEGKRLLVDVTPEKFYRSLAQNRALHLLFTQLADELNDHGLDMKQIIRFDIPWDGYTIKNHLWKPLQKVMVGETSTTRLKRDQLDKIYNVLMKEISERSKGEIYIPFPSEQTLIDEINKS